MKYRLIGALLVLSAGLAGCESLSDAASDVRERLAARNEPRMRTFSAAPRPTFDAVKVAASRMGFRMTRGGPAQGEYEGVSGVGAGERMGSARQVGIKVRLEPTLDATGTEVAVRLTEIIEADSTHHMGMATEATMRDTPLYESFFRNVQQALDAPPVGAGASAGENTPQRRS